jgi:hypothetical protein
MCEIETFLVSVSADGRMYGSAMAAAQHRCKTHNWDFPLGATMVVGGECPLGRIETATANALAEIERAQRKGEPR